MSNKELRKTLKMNLQFFAEGGEGSGEQVNNGGQGEMPTMDQLIERITALETANAQKDAEIQQWKNSSDKASSQAADFKRQLTARMSAQEQADQAKKEADEAMKNELASLRQRIAITEATKRYMKLGMDEATAEATANAEISGDMEGVSKNFATLIESVKTAEWNRFLKERPEINAGHGDSEDDPAMQVVKSLQSNHSKQSNKDILKNYI